MPMEKEPEATPQPAAPVKTGGLKWIVVIAIAAAGAAALYFWLGREESAARVSERTGIVLLVGPFEGEGAGLAEELSADMARSPLVRVRPAASAPAGTASGLVYRLRGDVRREDGLLEVNAQLLDAASGEIVWGEQFRLPEQDAGSARRAAVDRLSSEAMLPLLKSAKSNLLRQPLTELEPWALSLLVTWVPGDEVRPVGPPSEDSYWLQRRALELDPDFAPAHALFAELAAYHALFHPPADTVQARARAARHARRAIELAPYDSEILYQLALYNRFAGERARAIALLERVLELQPNHPLAPIDLAFVRGQCSIEAEAAIAELEKMTRPLSPSNSVRWVALAHIANLQLSRGDYTAARDTALQSRKIVPITWTAMTLAAAEAGLGNEAAALATLAEHRREWPDMDVDYFAAKVVPRWCLGGVGTPEMHRAFRRLAAAARAAKNQKKIS
jgi:tetratricopeptide (TPR) repeat protein